ncbi:MAG: ABC transporter permease [Clostridiales bacterium]|nr:ABC transporter permease [Clostridiales bacterium]
MRIIEKTKTFLYKEKGKAKAKLLKLMLGAPFWIIVAALILIAFGAGRAIYLTDTRTDQYMAEAWQNGSETSFRHMAVYAGGIRTGGDTTPMVCAEGGKSIRLADITEIRKSLQSSASTGSDSSGKSSTFREDKLKGWEDCYSSTVMANVDAIEVREGREIVSGSADVQLVAVGGNYKAFHPFRFLSGGFLPETPVDTYQIVINDVLAWKFYRSYDVTGNILIINGQMFTIIGVVEEKNTKVAELAGEQSNRAFIYFAALEKIYDGGANPSSVSDSSGSGDYADYGDYGNYGDYSTSGTSSNTGNGYIDYAIQCYEAMLPELVKGVAVSDFKNAMPNYSLTNPQVYIVNDTGRFGVTRVFDTAFPLGETDRERLGYEFPYWEIAAQMTEQRLLYDYIIIGVGILLIFIGGVMIGLKFRAKKSVRPEEMDGEEEEEVLETETKELLLR